MIRCGVRGEANPIPLLFPTLKLGQHEPELGAVPQELCNSGVSRPLVHRLCFFVCTRVCKIFAQTHTVKLKLRVFCRVYLRCFKEAQRAHAKKPLLISPCMHVLVVFEQVPVSGVQGCKAWVCKLVPGPSSSSSRCAETKKLQLDCTCQHSSIILRTNVPSILMLRSTNNSIVNLHIYEQLMDESNCVCDQCRNMGEWAMLKYALFLRVKGWQNRIYVPHMTVCLVPCEKYCIHTVYIWFWPTLCVGHDLHKRIRFCVASGDHIHPMLSVVGLRVTPPRDRRGML